MLTRNHLLSEIVNLDDLPSPPMVAAKLIEIYSQKNVQISELAKTIAADPVVSARMIAYANSPLSGIPNECRSLEDAINAVGVKVVKTIALSFSIADSQEFRSLDLRDFWNQALLRAVAAKVLCIKEGLNGEYGFLAGLMMEIGKLAIEVSEKSVEEIVEIQPQLQVGQSHNNFGRYAGLDVYRLGAMLVSQWQFPHEVVSAIATLNCDQRSQFQNVLLYAQGIGQLVFDESIDYYAIQDVKKHAVTVLHTDEEAAFEAYFQMIMRAWIEYASVLKNAEYPAEKSSLEREAKRQIRELSLEVQQENLQISRENDMLREQANVDELTQLPNRRAWNAIGQQEWARAFRTQTPFTLMVIDIDHFKKVNDTFGHLAGDVVLRGIAKIFESSVREYDHVFRFGGEEFVILFPSCRLPTALSVADRIIDTVRESRFEYDDQIIRTTVSIGAVSYVDNNFSSLESMFAEADKQLFLAKQAGRDCVRGELWSI